MSANHSWLGKHILKHLKTNVLDFKWKKWYSKLTHKILNSFPKKDWKSKFKVPEVDKKDERYRKKAKQLKET